MKPEIDVEEVRRRVGALLDVPAFLYATVPCVCVQGQVGAGMPRFGVARCGKPADASLAGPARCRECRTAAARRVRLGNPEKYRRKSLEAWRALSPEAKRARRSARKARQRGATLYGPVNRARIHAEFPRCAYCGREDVERVLDHVIPLALGGPHHDLNLIPACRPCNEAKGAQLRLLSAWRSSAQAAFVEAVLSGLDLDTRRTLGFVVTA